tara:strand:+ start:37148 stop:37789 length:642 start_codon:yes stop_codon:yes gene_type:complete
MASARINRKNSKGFLTVEFSVALLISVAFSIMFFCIAFTLSTAFVAQYVAFSVGRIYSGGHVSVTEQEALARKKFTKMMAAPGMGKLFSQGWFTLGYDNPAFRSGVGGEVFSDYTSASPDGTRLAATGVRLVFGTKLLNLKLGPLGSTNPNDEPMNAKVTGLMIRNPTQEECQKFFNVENRHRALIDIDGRFGQYDTQAGSNPKYFPMEDNGC